MLCPPSRPEGDVKSVPTKSNFPGLQFPLGGTQDESNYEKIPSSIMKQFVTLVAFVLFALVTYCSGADYYIDSVNGSDDNNGLSIRKPWKSHMKAESALLAA